MTAEIITIIECDFVQENRKEALDILSEVTLDHVMANSEHNLRNTRLAILKLAKGDLSDLKEYTDKAKIDFRDVIMWAMNEE